MIHEHPAAAPGHRGTLVLLHGITDSGRCWPDAVPRWTAAGWRVLACDARGHGDAPRWGQERPPGDVMVDDVVDLLERERGGRVVIIGHSMGAAVGAAAVGVDAYLMGRVLYEEWAGYWPDHADEPFGDVINPIQKYVVSSTLQSADWQNTELLGADAVDRLRELKETDGGDISMSGSATTVRWLLREGLLDELNLLVHPIAVGGGKARLFPADEPTVPLKLLSSETFPTGVLNLSYAPAEG